VSAFQAAPACRGDQPSVNVSFTIEENTAPGSIVGYLSSNEYFDAINRNDDVTDPESGRETFWLVDGNALDTFSVDAVSGALAVGGPVDFELCSWYGLVVRILDGVGKCVGEMNVDVALVNVNDNPPQFDVDLTYITVREATPPGAAVYAPVAHDADGPVLFYAVRAGQSSEGVVDWLGVDDVTGQVVTRRPLGGAPRRMHVVITASDVSGDVSGEAGHHVTSMTLVVTVVKDSVAGCGRGGGRTQRVRVAEDAEVGGVVAAAEVDDVMTSSCNSVPTYTIISSNDYDKFIVDRLTGR